MADSKSRSGGRRYLLPESVLPRVDAGTPSRIPRVIYQTCRTGEVPIGMYNAAGSWMARNPEYAYEFFDDERMSGFIERFDCSGFAFGAHELARAFARIRPGAGKADLFRYLLVHERGGVYMDIDTFCIGRLGRFVGPEDDVVSGIGGRGDLHQWGLVYSPKHPFMKRVAELTVANILAASFVAGYENSLEGVSGPPCLDLAVKEVLGLAPSFRFSAGTFVLDTPAGATRLRLLDGDCFAGNVGFKYSRYRQDLASLGIDYWMDEELFNT
jgi:hypothetical protein